MTDDVRRTRLGTVTDPRPFLSDRGTTTRWAQFVSDQGALVLLAGLPESATVNVSRFREFLETGRADRDEGGHGQMIGELDEEQYAALVTLVAAFFSAGFPWFDSPALDDGDRAWLKARFNRS